ncbi:MAG: transporter substrate-binding domain-containing protein [Cyanobacteriota bacterium]|nr:transporter substrate-binding domain-containing protein [Cyanobacteriota bacterium]
MTSAAISVLGTGTAAAATPLSVGVVDDALPCSDFRNGFPRGSAVDLWQAIAHKTQLTFNYVPLESPNQAVQRAASGDIDLAVSCLNVTPLRLEQVSFSSPYQEDSLALLTHREEESFLNTIGAVITDPMIRDTTLLLFAVSFVAAILLWLMSKGFDHKDIIGRNSRHTFFKGWMMIGMGTGIYKMGTTPPSVSMVALTNFFRLVITSIFVGSATNVLLEQRDPVDASNAESIAVALQNNVGVDAGTVSQLWLEKQADGILSVSESLQRIVPLSGDSALINALEDNKVQAIMADTSRIKFLWGKTKTPDQYEMQARTFNTTPQGFIFGHNLGAEKRKAINIAISDLRFEGDIEEIIKRWEPKIPQ